MIRLCFFLFFLGSSVYGSDTLRNSCFEVIVHRVGTGQCIVINGKKFSMMLDCGSTEYTPSYRVAPQGGDDLSLKKGELLHTPSPKTTLTATIKSERKQNVAKDVLLTLEKQSTATIKKFMIENIRESIKEKNNQKGRFLKTLFITHPDVDHYNLAPEIFQASDTIESIVLGGDPLNYTKSFTDWLKKMVQKAPLSSKIYFLALTKPYDLIETSKKLAELLATKYTRLSWAPYTPMITTEDFLKIDDKNVRVQLLGVNTLHYAEIINGRVNKIARGTYKGAEADDNADSFFVKVVNKTTDASILLSGDATELTTKRLLDYSQEMKEIHLPSTILLAAHHGADSYGTNNNKWNRAVNPDWIFISVGLRYAHPTQKIYNRLKKLEHLNKFVTIPHAMVTGEKEIKERKTTQLYRIGQTNRPILSTLANGTLHVIFLDKPIEECSYQVYTYLTQASTLPTLGTKIQYKKLSGAHLDAVETPVILDYDKEGRLNETSDPISPIIGSSEVSAKPHKFFPVEKLAPLKLSSESTEGTSSEGENSSVEPSSPIIDSEEGTEAQILDHDF